LRKTGGDGYWMQHVGRYSKRLRNAPIYWPLQSSKKNYALWIYGSSAESVGARIEEKTALRERITS